MRNALKLYNNVAVSAVYRLPGSLLGASTLEDYVFASFTEVLNRQPIMGVTLENEGGPEPKWIRLPNHSLNLNEVIKFEKADPKGNLDSLILQGFRAPFERVGELPLWRAIIISSQDIQEDADVSFAIAFYFHHGIADGSSGAAFHLTFLDALNDLVSSGSKPPSSNEFANKITIPELALLSNVEKALSLPISILFFLKIIFKEFIYHPTDPLRWTGPPASYSSRPPLNSLQSFILSPDLVQNLLSKCRANKTSITALITVLTARKLALIHAPTYSHFIGNIPFSLLKFMKSIGKKDMGLFISNLNPYFSSEPNPPGGYISCRSTASPEGLPQIKEDVDLLWQSAQQCKKFIDEGASTHQNLNIGMLKFVPNFKKYFLGMDGQARQNTFEITNIGVCDGGAGDDDATEGKKVVFDRMLFASGLSNYATPYTFCLSTAKGGDMTVTLCWDTGVIENEDAIEMSGWMEEQLKGLAGA